MWSFHRLNGNLVRNRRQACEEGGRFLAKSFSMTNSFPENESFAQNEQLIHDLLNVRRNSQQIGLQMKSMYVWTFSNEQLRKREKERERESNKRKKTS